MKRIIITASVLLCFLYVSAQPGRGGGGQPPSGGPQGGQGPGTQGTATPTLNYKSLEKKWEKSNEDIQDEKKSLKPKTWIKRGELLQDIHDVNIEFVRLGMAASEADLLMGSPNETKTNEQGQELRIYDRITLIFKNNEVVDWVETQTIQENPLPLALESFTKALELDEEGKNDNKIREDLDRLKQQFERDAVLHYLREDYAKALENFEFILKTSETPVYDNFVDSMAIFNAALSASLADKHEQAVKYYERAVDINYGGGDAYLRLAREFLAMKDSTKALDNLQQGFKMYPDSTSILYEMINYYLNSGDSEAGMKYLNLALEKDTSNPSIYFAKGTLYDRLGDKEKAIESYNKSIEVDPEYFNGWFNLGALYYNNAVEMYDIANEKEDLEEYNKAKQEADEALKIAIEPLEKARSINPKDIDALRTLQTIYYRLKMTDKYEEVKAILDELTQ